MKKDKIKSLTPHFGKAQKNLYSWKELEGLINLRPFVTTERFVVPQPPHLELQYNWNNSPWASEKDAWPVSCLKDVLTKTSVYFRDCSRVNEKINSLCKKLEDILESPVDCHIYFSIDKSLHNFGKHADDSHNVIMVSDGMVNCEVWTDAGVMSKELHNGDYVFIPAKMYHKITPLTDKRLCLSFPIALDEEVDKFTHGGESKNYYEEREWLRFKNLTKT